MFPIRAAETMSFPFSLIASAKVDKTTDLWEN